MSVDSVSLVRGNLCHMLQSSREKRIQDYMYTSCLLSNGHGGFIPLSTVLLDTGSVVTSVVNKRVIKLFSDELDIEISPANMLLTLADAETPIRIDQVAILHLVFRDRSGAPHRMQV